MYLTLAESVELASVVVQKKDTLNEKNAVVVCPTFPALWEVSRCIKESGSLISLGAQDVFWENRGAFTGEVSATDLRELECRYVIIGHSERRQHTGETDDMVAKKMRTTYAAGLQPILCVGETDDERASGRVEDVLQGQVSRGVSLVQTVESVELIVAYEPRWAIGTGTPVDPEEATRVAELIRNVAVSIGFHAERIAVLYGGSVVPENIVSFFEAQSIDGVLVGGASTRKDQFIEIIEKVCG